MTSRSWINDFEDRRRFAQKLREEENWTSDEEDESEKTVGKIIKGSSQSYNDIPLMAVAETLREEEKWSSDEEEKIVASVDHEIWLESSFDHEISWQESSFDHEISWQAQTSRSWINDFEDRRRFALKLREEENWTSDEEDKSEKTVGKIIKGSSQSYNDIPDERRIALAQKLREEEKWSSDEEVARWSRSSPVQGPYLSYNNIRKAFAQILKLVLCWRCVKEDESEKIGSSQSYNDIPEERRIALAQKLREEEKWSKVALTLPCKLPSSRSQGSSRMFSKCEIHEATNNLSDSLKIGEGGYGTVYKGYIDNTEVAIKILSDKSDHGMKAFHRELCALKRVRHANLVNLIGTCSEVGALVYEYVPNGSLEDCLMERSAELTWKIRTRIIYEICKTLMFLHANQPDPLVHGDLKPSNVLLDTNFETKLADFGLCRFLTQGRDSSRFHRTMMLFGSLGYIDPDFMETLVVRPAIDVYSFGKTIIRILTKERPAEISRKVHEARKTKTLMTIVDPAARGWPEEIVELLARFALRCCKYDRYKPEFMRKFYRDLKMKLDSFWLI